MAETHAAVVFFVGERAFKVKKALDLGFVDFRRREVRESVCHREVELNRRLAPDVYLGVADVHGTDGRPCEHLVVMRRLPPDRRLSRLVSEGTDVDDELRRVADLMAHFHAEAERAPAVDAAATAPAVAALWEANGAGLAPFVGTVLDPAVAGQVEHLARRYVGGRAQLFERRITEGRVRDGHGDLLADDIFCLSDGPRVLDCLEFDDRLRYGDVLADVAFLAMDLERLGRPDLAGTFLARYGERTGDAWPASLAHHYIAYRAHVRCKVACLRGAQGDPGAAGEAGRLLTLAFDHLAEGRVRLVLVGGPPGSGKSTLASGLAGPLGAVVLRSDVVRKELVGMPLAAHAPAPAGQGIYRPEVTDATYGALLDRAAAALHLGETVVLDASWSQPRFRAAASALAERTSTDLVELRCVAPPDVAARRVVERARAGDDPSDATEEVARAMDAARAPWPSAFDVHTDAGPEAALSAALARVRAAPVSPSA